MKKPLVLCFCALEMLPFAKAQDNHYESNQIGSQNSILCGASLSRWVDQTAVINNAATMIFAKESGFTLNTATASFESILFRNGLGEGFNLKSNSTLIFPGLVAWEIPSLQRKGQRAVGVSIYGRMHDRLHYSNRVLLNKDIIGDAESPGEEQFTQLYSLNSDVDESAGALGWAERLSDDWAVGFTTQFFFRSQKYEEFFSANVFTNPGANPEVVRSESDVNVRYNASLLQFKGSLAWQNAGWSAGLAITAPTMRLWSSGDMLAEISLTNIRIQPDSARNSYLASTYLPDAKPRYKYPLSISGGVSKHLNDVYLSVSGSWYAPLKRYIMIDPSAETSFQPADEENALYAPRLFEVWSINRSVANFFTSALWQVSDATSLSLGFHTDYHFSEFPASDEKVPGFQLNKKIWNRYHFSGGAEIRRSRSFWIVGVQYSLGADESYPSPYRLDDSSEGNFLKGEYGTGTIRQNSLSFLLSFFFQFQRGERQDKKN